MLNFNNLKNNIEQYKILLKKKNFLLNTHFINFIYKKISNLKKYIEILQKKRNKINNLLKKKIINDKKLFFIINIINNKLRIQKPILLKIQSKFNKYLLNIPNIPDTSIIQLSKNKEIYKWGVIKKFNFNIKNHIQITCINKILNYLDFNIATKLTKSKFVLIKGELARLYRILGQFMLDIHIYQHNYQEIYVPYIVNKKSLISTGQLPKFENELFYVNTKLNNFNNEYNNFALIPTAEVPLINIIRNSIITEKELPIKLVALTPCFRVEAGSYGKNNKGLIRLHQFDKVELVQITNNEKSMLVLEEITLHAENILKLLKLPYRKILLSSNEINFTSSKTYDLEVWIPSLKNYLEVSSCSNTTDFQSRRLKAKYKNKYNKLELVHILNASGLAIGRVLLAIIENYQNELGNIIIPKILHSYYKNNQKEIILNI